MVCESLELMIRNQSKFLVLTLYMNTTLMDSHNNGHFPIPFIICPSLGLHLNKKHQSQYVVFFVESDATDRFIFTSAIIQLAQ